MERSINLSVILWVWMEEVIRANGNFIFQSVFDKSFFSLFLHLKYFKNIREGKRCIYTWFYPIKCKKNMCVWLTLFHHNVSLTPIIKHWIHLFLRQQTVSLSIQDSQKSDSFILFYYFFFFPPPKMAFAHIKWHRASTTIVQENISEINK